MSSLKVKVFFLVGACVSLSAFADNAAEEIARMNESIAVLAAQKAELELKSQIASKQLELDQIKKSGSVAPEPESMPIINVIEGVDGKLSAGLLFSNGAQKVVRAGENIPGGWKVAKITVDSVSLVRKRKTVRLEFVQPSAAMLPASASAGSNSPSLPSRSPIAAPAASGGGFPSFAVGR